MASGRPYDYAVFIGRFQPFHNGHLRVVQEGLELADNLIILIGSSNVANDTRNPFTYSERAGMVRNAITTADNLDRLTIMPVSDYTYDDDAWLAHVKSLVATCTAGMVSPRIVLIGNERDHTSYYLRQFPGWNYHPVFDCNIQATEIRAFFFAGGMVPEQIVPLVPDTTMEFLRRFRDRTDYADMIASRVWHHNYRKEWGVGPFVTCDALVICNGKALLIERGRDPGKGMLAIPGGFLEGDEPLLSGALRELREETQIAVDEATLRHALRFEKTYADPHRSRRGRIVTDAFLFHLEGYTSPPEVMGADDAKKAMWVPLEEIRVDAMFEDHAHLVRDLIKRL